MPELVRNLKPGQKPKGTVHKCICCGELFFAKKGALFCSGACRIKYHRQKNK